MINEQEIYLFIKEIGRLLQDYEKSEEGPIRKEIEKDISLLCEAISI